MSRSWVYYQDVDVTYEDGYLSIDSKEEDGSVKQVARFYVLEED